MLTLLLSVLPMIADAQRRSHTTLRAIAAKLERLHVKTARPGTQSRWRTS